MIKRSFLTYSAIFILVLLLATCSSTREVSEEPASSIEQESVLTRYMYEHRETVKRQLKEEQQADITGPANIDSLLARMSLREKIGQLFLVYASGYFWNEDADFYRDLVEKVRTYKIGGVMFTNGNVYGQAVLLNKLQQVSAIPLWVTQDMEYGAAMRVRRTTRLPPAMGIAATGNPEYAYWAGKITAREARALGVHQVFAPVLDVNNNPDNPVINVRSFSADPGIVSTFGNAFIEGVQSEGVVATAKHFPGHGDTDVDSHLSLPVIDYDYTRLDTLELVPFRAAINNGISSIMSAHIAFPRIGSNGGEIPGTLDGVILDDILGDSLKFNGVVVTDGLEMSGISSNFSPGDAVIKALKAGADLMLLSPDEFTAIHEIEQHVKRGTITESRIDQSVRKLLAWKKEHGLFENRTVEIDKLSHKVNIRGHRLLADEIARKSVTVVKNRGEVLPVRPSDFPKIMVLSIADDESGRTGTSFAREIENYHPDVTFHVYDKRSSEEEKQEILRDAQNVDLVILGSFIFVRSHKPIQLPQDRINFIRKVIDTNKKSVLVAFGNPYVVRDLPNTDVHVMAWSSDYNQVINTVPALFGASHVTGRMPINIPGMYKIDDGLDIPQTTIRYDEPETAGISSDSLRQVENIMQKAVLDSTFPGGVVTVLKNGVVAYQEGFGYHTYDKLKKVNPTDVYDLASLTKVVGTTTAIMKLVDSGLISLDDPVLKYIPEYNIGDKRKVTIRHLLLHTSGLPPFRIYVDSIRTREVLVEAVKNEPLINPPGARYVYSDLGFILLADIVSDVSGDRIDSYLRKNFYYPMGMSSTFFNPSRLGPWMLGRIPPTEIDTVYRKKLVKGEVNDERAYYLDGVAGHAGLFSSGYDLAVFSQMILNKGFYGGQSYLSPETVERFTGYRSDPGNRALGYDRRSDGFSTAGTLSGPNTFGHLGFTGTSLWIDPDRDLAIILLTNRTYPHRSYGEKINEVRASVADAVINSITDSN